MRNIRKLSVNSTPIISAGIANPQQNNVNNGCCFFGNTYQLSEIDDNTPYLIRINDKYPTNTLIIKT